MRAPARPFVESSMKRLPLPNANSELAEAARARLFPAGSVKSDVERDLHSVAIDAAS